MAIIHKSIDSVQTYFVVLNVYKELKDGSWQFLYKETQHRHEEKKRKPKSKSKSV